VKKRDLARPLPSALNLTIMLAASAASTGLLYAASHAHETWLVVLSAIGFSFTANTLFSLFHESVHGIFHANKAANEWGGRFLAAWFPTGLSVQRAFHLTHHRNNRSASEQFDYLHEGDKRWLKYSQWYAILTGAYWAVAVFGVAVYVLCPWLMRMGALRDEDNVASEQTGADSYLGALDALPWLKPRLEILFSFAFQGVLFWALDLTFAGWLACYAAFAFQWSGLQYADHAFSALHVKEGAWNLRVNPVSRAFFLNYHHHLAHHRHPTVSWRDLGRFVDASEPEPRFVDVWLEMWKGPRPFPKSQAPRGTP
jgi:fatty acid desaturase